MFDCICLEVYWNNNVFMWGLNVWEKLLLVKIGNVKVDESQMVFFNDYPTSIEIWITWLAWDGYLHIKLF